MPQVKVSYLPSSLGNFFCYLWLTEILNLNKGIEHFLSLISFSAAINQLTKNLACEWAKDNIRSNCVVPGTTKTSLVEHVIFSLPIFVLC